MLVNSFTLRELMAKSPTLCLFVWSHGYASHRLRNKVSNILKRSVSVAEGEAVCTSGVQVPRVGR